MGYTRYDSATWAGYSADTAGKSHLDYRRGAVLPAFDPTKFGIRESRKSLVNPMPTPIIAALDVTGSMGRVVEAMRKGLGTLFEQIIERRPVTDPHVMAMAIGDFECDRGPVQATQFEADPVTIGKQVEDLWLERGGGGNDFEGYLGPLYFAAMRTATDAVDEGRKGFLFTVGDEQPQQVLRAAHITQFFGDAVQRDLSAQDLVTLVSRGWNYFHLMVEEGSHMQSRPDAVRREWSELLGQRALLLSDHTRMAEVIISAIEVMAGRDKDTVAKSWSGSTALVVKRAIGGLAFTAPGKGPIRV